MLYLSEARRPRLDRSLPRARPRRQRRAAALSRGSPGPTAGSAWAAGLPGFRLDAVAPSPGSGAQRRPSRPRAVSAKVGQGWSEADGRGFRALRVAPECEW